MTKENTVVITEQDGKYQIQNNGISEFALLGILECIVFDMKSINRQEPTAEQSKIADEPKKTDQELKEKVPEQSTSDLRTRIGNAIKAIKSLGGEVERFDLSSSTDEELRTELEGLTNQYKRLKNSKGAVK